MKIFNNISKTLTIFVSIMAFNTIAADGKGYLYQHEILSHLDKVTAKDPNADAFDPASGMISFTATDILLSGNSKLKVQLRRVLATGTDETSNATTGFGGSIHTSESKYELPPLEKMNLWSLDVPHIYADILAGAGILIGSVGDGNWLTGDECTGDLPPRLTQSSQGGGAPSDIGPEEYWSGATLHIPGEVTEQFLKPETDHPNYSLGLRTTKSNWVYNRANCYSRDDQGVYDRGGFIVNSPDGRKFYFDVKKDLYRKNPVTDIYNRTQKVRRLIFASRVEDKFGNWVNYNWQDGLLTSIEAKDGRKITLNYDKTNSHGIKYLTSANAHGKTWKYDYMGPGGNGAISKVTLPDNTTWEYGGSYSPFSASPTPNGGVQTVYSDGHRAPPGACQLYKPSLPRGRTEFTITDPDGVIYSYKLGVAVFARYQVKTGIVGTYSASTDSTRITNLNCTINLALFEKTITGPGLPLATSNNVLKWTYEYSENAGTYVPKPYSGSGLTLVLLTQKLAAYDDYVDDSINISSTNLPTTVSALGANHLAMVRTTLVKGPDSRQLYYVNRNAYSISEDKIIAVDYLDPTNNALLKRVENTYEQGDKIGGQQIGYGFDFSTERNLTKMQHRADLTEVQTKLGSDTYTIENEYDDFYGQVTATKSDNNFHLAKYSKYTYTHDTDFWHLNQPSTTSVSSDGINFHVTKATKYQTLFYPSSGKALIPKYEYSGDFTTDYSKSYSFNEDGTLGGISFNRFRLNADGNESNKKISQGFSNYYRGVPRTVSMSNRYNSASQNIIVEVDDFANITKFTDLEGKVINYSYDKLNRIKTVNYQDETIADTYYNWSKIGTEQQPSLQVSRCTLVNGTCTGSIFSTTTTYDALLRATLIENKDLVSNTSIYTKQRYHANGQVDFKSYPSTSSNASTGAHYLYDALQRLTQTSMDGKGTQKTKYLSLNRIEVTDEVGNVTITSYHAYGQPEYAQAYIIYSPEDVNTIIQVDVFGNVTHIAQQGIGTPPDVMQHQYNAYDDNRNLCKISRKDTGVTLFNYNHLGELQWKEYGGSFSFDNVDNCTGSVPLNQHIDYVYDNLGTPWKTQYATNLTPELTYTYSPKGNLTQLVSGDVTQKYTYTGNQWLDTETTLIDGRSWLYDYDYTKLGHLARLQYPNGDKVDYNPNNFGQTTKVARLDMSYADNVKYYSNGILDSFTYGNGLQHKTYLGTNNLPSQIIDSRTGLNAVNLSYSYYNNLSIKAIIDNVNPAYSITNMIYDGLDRLTNTWGGSAIGNSTISYDELGNILTYKSKGRDLAYTYNSNYQLSKVDDSIGDKDYSTFVHTPNGNIIYNGNRSFTYNDNNLITESGSNSYIYDGHNRRVKVNDSKGVSYSLYSLTGKLLYRETAEGGINYIFLGDKLIAKEGTGVTLGSDSRMHYRPFGESIEEPKDDVGYTGHKFDTDLGLSYMQARYYDPVIGRFYSNDPVGWNPQNPVHSFGRYTYANNNPYKYTDPNGEEAKESFEKEIEKPEYVDITAEIDVVVSVESSSNTTLSTSLISGEVSKTTSVDLGVATYRETDNLTTGKDSSEITVSKGPLSVSMNSNNEVTVAAKLTAGKGAIEIQGKIKPSGIVHNIKTTVSRLYDTLKSSVPNGQ